jgi:hypothetical protein
MFRRGPGRLHAREIVSLVLDFGAGRFELNGVARDKSSFRV